jgi:itaconate CoA-transferase
VRFNSNLNRVENRAALDAVVERVFATLTATEIIERLDRASIANARMNTVQEFLDHPQLAARNRWRAVDSPVGPLRALIPAATLSGVDPVMGPIPCVGEHTETILAELGFDAETVARWRDHGVI